MTKTKKTWLIIILLIILSLGIRLVVAFNTHVIFSDGPVYIKVAQDYAEGNFRQALDHPYHPLYPLLISLIYRIMGNWEWAGIFISIVLSSLAVIPIYYIGRQVFNESIASVSCIFYAFLPHAARLSAQVLTTGTFIFLLISSIWFFMMALNNRKHRFFLLAGGCALLAYLTRPDGIIMLFIFIGWAILQDISNWRREAIKKRVLAVFMLILPCLVLALPYCWYKGWSLTGKFSTEEIKQMLTVFFSGSGYGRALIELVKDLRVFHPLLGILLLVGLFKKRKGQNYELGVGKDTDPGLSEQGYTNRKQCAWLLWSIFLLYIVTLFSFTVVFGRVSKRYTTPLVPLVIFWSASGLFYSVLGLHQLCKRHKELIYPVGWFRIAVVITVIILSFTTFIPIGRERLPEKEVGEWLKQYHKTHQAEPMPEPPIIIVDSTRIAYYAGGEVIGIKKAGTNYRRLITRARRVKASYLVIDNEIDRLIPGFTASIRPEDLQELGFIPDTKSRKSFRAYKIVLE